MAVWNYDEVTMPTFMTFTASLSHMITIIVLLSHTSPLLFSPPYRVKKLERKWLEKSKQTHNREYTLKEMWWHWQLRMCYKNSLVLQSFHSGGVGGKWARHGRDCLQRSLGFLFFLPSCRAKIYFNRNREVKWLGNGEEWHNRSDWTFQKHKKQKLGKINMEDTEWQKYEAKWYLFPVPQLPLVKCWW